MVEWADMSGLHSEGGQGTPKRINCFKCVHFRINWDPQFPRTCTFFGFSGPEMPSETVRKTTGKDCPSFERKPERKQNS